MDGDRLIIIDDMIGSSLSLDSRLERLQATVKIDVAAVMTIADTQTINQDGTSGTEYIEKKYSTRVYTLITDDDIRRAREKHVV